MLSLERVKFDIETWLREFVNKPQEVLNGLPPCPYALNAWTNNKVKVQISSKAKLVKDIRLVKQKWDPAYDVVILVISPTGISTEDLHALTAIANDTVLVPNGFVALEDHPDTTEAIGDLKFNMGKYALVLLQDKIKLHDHAKLLAVKGYYDGWDEEYLQDVFAHRRDPRR